MTIDDTSTMFRALGDPTRLRIFEFLRSCGEAVALGESGEVHPMVGPTIGEVCCRITGADKINSTISHHVRELRLAGLIEVEQRGKNRICCVRNEAVRNLAEYLAGARVEDAELCCFVESGAKLTP